MVVYACKCIMLKARQTESAKGVMGYGVVSERWKYESGVTEKEIRKIDREEMRKKRRVILSVSGF